MKAIGCSGYTLTGFKFYLSERDFFVNIDSEFSIFLRFLTVSHEGLLGPLLFLIYINDIPQAVSTDLLVYSNDSGLVFQHKDNGKINK